MQRVGEVTNGAKAGDVNRGHTAQPQNDDRRQLVQGVKEIGELVSRAEEKRAMNGVPRRPMRRLSY